LEKEHVDRAIFIFGRCDQRLDVFFEPDVGGNSQSVDVAGHAASRSREVFRSATTTPRAPPRHSARHRRANSARSAGVNDTRPCLDGISCFPFFR